MAIWIGSWCATSWRCGLKRAWRQLRAFFSPITAPGSVAPRQNDGFCSRRPLPDRPARSPGGDLEATSTRSEMVNASSSGPLAGGGEARRAGGKRRPRDLIEPAMMPAVVAAGRARRARVGQPFPEYGCGLRRIGVVSAGVAPGSTRLGAPAVQPLACQRRLGTRRCAIRASAVRAHDNDRRKHGSHHTA